MQIYFVAQGNNLNSYLLISPNIPIYNNTSKAKRKKILKIIASTRHKKVSEKTNVANVHTYRATNYRL